MNQRVPKAKLRLENPARYRIYVRGHLDRRWSDQLGGLTVTTFVSEEGEMMTRLAGKLMDQAALLGVLNALYELRLPLLAVEYLDAANDL